MSREEHVTIDGPYGALPGIVHLPDAPMRRRCCVIMLNAGQLGRAGPQRLYVNAARRWAAVGITVLRLDLAGGGDSAVENDERHFDGHRPDEAAAAVNYACDVLSAEAVFLQGLCAGARVALKCAARDTRVAGVLAWSCPALSSADGWPASPYENRDLPSVWRRRDTLNSAARAVVRLKFLRPGWWRERLRRRTDEARQLLRAVRRLPRGSRARRNPFLAAVDCLCRDGRDFLFLFGQCDVMELGEFRECFPGIAEGATRAQGFHVVPHGTHTFNALDSQHQVITLSEQWLRLRLERAAGAAVAVLAAAGQSGS